MSYELLAIARGGETYLTRRPDGQVFVHPRFQPGDPIRIGERAAERAIALEDFVAVRRQFESWLAIEAFVEDFAPKASLDVTVGPTAARLAPRILRRWLQLDDRAQLVPVVVGKLLNDDRIARDAELVHELASLLVRVRPPSATTPRLAPLVDHELPASARTEELLGFYAASS